MNLHSLVRLFNGSDAGWYHPSELNNPPEEVLDRSRPSDWSWTSLSGLSYALPVTKKNKPFSTYLVDIVSKKKDITTLTVRSDGVFGKFIVDPFTLNGFRYMGFSLQVKKARISDSALKYLGKLTHPDFEYKLVELRVDLLEMEKIFYQHGVIIMGCVNSGYGGMDIDRQ